MEGEEKLNELTHNRASCRGTRESPTRPLMSLHVIAFRTALSQQSERGKGESSGQHCARGNYDYSKNSKRQTGGEGIRGAPHQPKK